MAKSKIDKDDIKRLVENTSNPTSTTSVYSAKYIEENFLKEITKEAIEEVLTGDITSHEHNYTTSTSVENLINTAVASVYKPKGNIADKTALLALTNVKQGDVYNAQSPFTLSNGQNVQNVKAGDNIVCLSDAATSDEANWDNLCGNIDYEDLGDMPVATDTEVGGIKIGYDNILSASPEALPLRVDTGETANKDKAFVVLGGRKIKELLGASNSTNYNSDDVFISGISTTNYSASNNFNELLYIGSYKVNGMYSNAPKLNCGTSTVNTVVRGTLNVFRSGANDWETIQQLFWVISGRTEQYQRSYNGTTWTVWKRLIKCDDYADMDGNGGIISSANLAELFRAPDLIQLWNINISGLELEGGATYYLSDLSIDVPIQNILKLEGNNITGLTSGRVYRVTYDVHFVKDEVKGEGEGEVTIGIRDEYLEELHSIIEYISVSEIRKRITFSVLLTDIETVKPYIEVSEGLSILIHPHCYQVSVEEIKFPYFNPNPA